MRRIFIILLFFVSLSITAEEVHYLTNNVTDIRNKVWFYGTNSFDGIDTFLMRFSNQFVKKTIVTNNFSSLSGQNFSICKSLLERGRVIDSIPMMRFMVMIICDENYGVLLLWWDDTSSFGTFQDTGVKLMSRYFFELNPPK